jgi:hypothetical protein
MEAIAVAAQLLDEITWDGQALLVAAATENGRVTCRVPRETIHALRIYSDIIGREIQLERRNIVEKLAPLSDCKAVAGRCWRDAGAVAGGGR